MPKINDLVGQRFGRRVVLNRAAKYRDGRYKWTVRCDCGHVTDVLVQTIKRSPTCLQCAHKGPRPYRRVKPFQTVFRALMRHRHAVRLTYDQFVEFTKIPECHYCGATLQWTAHRRLGQGYPTNLDRKDSAKPYTVDNVVVCCPRCNKAKNNLFTYAEWVQIGAVIRERAMAKLQKVLESQK